MKLNIIYKSILRFCGLDADEQGYINTVLDDKPKPAFIDGLRMVLPVDNQLRTFNPKEKIVFHPFTENILRGESEIIQKLKLSINIRLNFTIGVIGQSLLNLVASPEQHSGLSPDQAELLKAIKDCDEKSVTTFISHMVAGMKAHPERIFTNVYLKRGGTYKTKRFARVGIVTFPFYELLKQDKVDKLRIKDKDTLKQLFQFIFPGIDEEEEYNFASNSDVAPYLEALMRTSANIASRLNDIILMYKDYIDEADILIFDSDWMEDFQDLNALIPEIRKVPVQHGNDGMVGQSEEQVVSYPVANQMQQPVGFPQPQMQGQVPPRPELKQTKRGLDFKSMAQVNPAIGMQMNPLMPQIMQAQQQAQMQAMANRVPSWAIPQQGMQPQPGMFPQPMMQPQFQQAQGYPPGVVMTPQGPAVITPQGLMPFQPNQFPGQMQPGMFPQPQMMQQGMNPTPSWAQPVQQGYYR